MSVSFLETKSKTLTQLIAPCEGQAFELARGQYLQVIDPRGQQVSDLFCFNRHNLSDALSSGRSIDYDETIQFGVGNRLYSQAGAPMLTIVSQTCDRHDFLLTPCNLKMFQVINKNAEYHSSCLESLEIAFQKYSINPDQISTTFNIFMNVAVALNEKIQILPPLSKAGDSILFRAEMDLIVGLTACADEGSNAGVCKPIQFRIYES